MIFEKSGNNLIIHGVENFDLSQTFDCGQAFRWSTDESGIWSAVVNGKLCKLSQCGSDITVFNCDREQFDGFFRTYLDIDRDYAAIIDALGNDPVMKKACAVAGGIRILRQEPWETVCSFIISQNNNIPRIKGIIERLCQNFGNEIDGGYTFPSAERISALSLDDLAVIRSGFRAKYILDAAKKLSSDEISVKHIEALPTDEARCELMKIYGVGEKVADCVLLFAFARIDAFPKDVWIKRATEKLFGGVLPECIKPYAGIAQQYLFHYARTTKLEI